MADSGAHLRNPNLGDYLSVSEAAQMLGVSAWTLRNWDNSGKLKARRHPINGHRLYRHEDLRAILTIDDSAWPEKGGQAPVVDWSAAPESGHFVQFYESDAFLVDSVGGFLGAALGTGDGGLSIATRPHQVGIEESLKARGIDVAGVRDSGRYVPLDAAETLAAIMVEGMPDPARFGDVIGRVIGRMTRDGRRISAFGEMVALLWAEGNRAGAIRLEELWNEMRRTHSIAVLCGYPIRGFTGEANSEPFHAICAQHAHVIPAESYAALASAEERLRAITQLQQKALSLEAEIAHRREVEKALARREEDRRQSDERFEQFMRNLPGLAWIKDLEGRYIFANDSALRAFQTTREALHAKTDVEIFPPQTAALFRDNDRRALASPAGVQVVETLAHDDGTVHHSLVSKFPIPGPDGRPALIGGMAIDITERKCAEDALREADQRKDEFLATLAHELRNPLAPIRNALEITRVTGGGERLRDMMERQVNHMVRLVDDLLEVSRLTRGQIELRKERMDLASAVRSALETSRPLIEAAGHHLTVSLPAEPLVVDADPVRLAQVFGNLLNNAAKYTEHGGRIELSAEREAHEAVVRVSDTGVGIPADMLPRVFEMFTQVDRSIGRSQGGLGIGLALVANLVRMHGGQVDASSAGPRQGSVFTVRLPLVPEAAPDEADKRNVARRRRRSSAVLRVLVVDDNRDSGDSLGMLLRLAGSQVEIVRDGPNALMALNRHRPDVVFLDLAMPGMDGYEVARRIRSQPRFKDVVLIALTGWGQEEDRRRSHEAGINHHLIKPVDLEAVQVLLGSIENAKSQK
jgi:PAS domain S-box-containing protein